MFLECHLTIANSDATTMMIQRVNPTGQYLGVRINAVRIVVAMNAVRTVLVFKETTSQPDLNCARAPSSPQWEQRIRFKRFFTHARVSFSSRELDTARA